MAAGGRERILVIDQGTHATRALALDAAGGVRCVHYATVRLRRIAADTVEQDPEEIVASAEAVIRALLADDALRGSAIVAAGLATQRSSVLAWDGGSGRPLSPVISWQDRRNARWLKRLEPEAERVKRLTGLRLSPHYGASKFRWMLDHLPAVRRAEKDGSLVLGPLSSFLVYRLLKEAPPQVDHGNALRTQLVNLGTLDWDPAMLAMFGLRAALLPVCRTVRGTFGELRAAAVPLTAVNGDQNAAVYGLGSPRRHQALINMGTGAFVLLPTGSRRVDVPDLLCGLSSSHRRRRAYVVEGTVNGAGAALEWAAQRWQLGDPLQHLDRGLGQRGPLPIFVNAIGGLGSPWWRPGPRPRLADSRHCTTAGCRVAAVAESILFMLNANLRRMIAAGLRIDRLQISGGLSRSDAVCRRLADLVQLPVYRPAEVEATARGAAWLAAGEPRRWPKGGRGKQFHPRTDAALQDRYRRFLELIDGG